MKLTAENVNTVFKDCLFKEGEDTASHVKAQVVMNTFGFHPKRLESHRADIKEMLAGLPPEFSKGGGWSFLNACMDKDGAQWGEHRDIDILLALGIATGQARIDFPRELWSALPGGLPYFTVIE
jgi:hypothetical protein